jgi:Asp-tRNA(Asn)/Glu-tRNA(Gln) amidotransferase A subunit family amidase
MVIPLHNDSPIPYPALDPKSFPILPENLPGRYYSIAEYHAMYLSGKLTPLAVVESLLPLIRRDASEASHHSIAFIDSHPEEILEAARASTLRYKEGKSLSIFDGVPTAIKDESDVAGYRTTMGRSRNDKIFPVAKESAWSILKWEEAGGIVLGKLNMHELGADTTNNNPNWGTPRNPHNDRYYTGGSSGGAAYVVSAGLVPVALGADGGGSIRIPSSFCGIYGLKPSHGRLEDTDSTVTVTGPLAATMSDLEAAYRIMAIPNPADPNSGLFSPPGVALTSRPKVIGIYKEWFNRADPAVLKLCNEVVSYYSTRLGYEVVSIEIPYVPEGQAAHAVTILAEMANRARQNPNFKSNWLSGITPANKILLAVGNQTPARDYLLAQQLRNMQMQHLAFLYQKHPGLIIVTPTTPMAGWPIANEGDLKHGVTDGNTSIRNMEYVWLANFTGNPAISCPIGYVDAVKGQGAIPVGLMAMGEWGSEDALIAWGKEAETWLNEEYPGGRQRPANWEDVIGNAKGTVQSE